MKEIKWSQWSPYSGMIRCGRADYNTLMSWMVELGKDAMNCLKKNGKAHALYGRNIHNDDGEIVEVRFYCDTYLEDDELIDICMKNPKDHIFCMHKR